ncbi:hypothetical protein SAMD00019534_068610 [Acytostelium subglobosum LB1]|uniref:hypothetical protein n=1 Tax=Acytostelium subglobosum LB1 TaxID=1410327 RepID=UPI0006449E9D|nr:hypothetical protein SAMD00019534_068610 [Acytostelium subglobosum LB1]GAM23686.1 hypothetical protein SAMD00019534_068610 [Acytostelium subglobosum LB1]|eukprot:XP_012753427.1 hypothetical protein SAMD00019534_068610 [Acytostelium subglobosum LB1]
MSSLLEELTKKRSLRNVETIVTNKDGSKVVINMNQNGHESVGLAVDGAPSCGYIIDRSPDDKVYKCDLSTYGDKARLYIGSQDAAFNREELSHNSITMILNVGFGIQNAFTADPSITYLSVDILDDIDQNIVDCLPPCFKFLDEAITRDTGVLVHCNAGVSRSATVLIAFLIRRLRQPLSICHSIVKSARKQVQPNQGFMKQLANYERVELANLQRL